MERANVALVRLIKTVLRTCVITWSALQLKDSVKVRLVHHQGWSSCSPPLSLGFPETLPTRCCFGRSAPTFPQHTGAYIMIKMYQSYCKMYISRTAKIYKKRQLAVQRTLSSVKISEQPSMLWHKLFLVETHTGFSFSFSLLKLQTEFKKNKFME